MSQKKNFSLKLKSFATGLCLRKALKVCKVTIQDVISRTAWTQLKDVKERKNKMKENAKATRRIKRQYEMRNFESFSGVNGTSIHKARSEMSKEIK